MARPKRDELALLAAADLLREQEEQELVYTTSYLAQVCLPYRDPGDVPVWQRRNGDIVMTVRPGYTTDPLSGKAVSLGYPTGVVPRWALFYVINEALQNESPTIVLGDGVVEFFRKINPEGKITGGKTGSLTRMITQTNKLFNAAISVERKRVGPDGERATLTTNMSVAHRVLMWGEGGDDRAVIQLSADFFDEIMNHAVPLDLGALRIFGDDAWCIDLYNFLNWQFHNMQGRKTALTIPLDEVNAQFGNARQLTTPPARYKFRKALESKLDRVMKVWDDANVELTTSGLILRPSRPHVRDRGQLVVEKSASTQLMLEA
ncbi:replication protein RepA [Nocardia sp. NPDC052001]|uniref:replication protein RepA n=1 Tax=Nocardia sp. NPDC052001 TaxID=3154853 RepID=UPI00343801E1